MNISLFGLLILLVLSLVVGMMAQAILRYPGGLLTATATGFVGGFIGILLSQATGLPELLVVSVGGMRFPIAWALLGSVILLLVVSAVTRGRTYRYG